MNLDRDELRTNGPDERVARINAPPWTDSFTLDGYPRDVPASYREWRLQIEDPAARRGGLILHGDPGLGKTVLGVCALRSLAAQGYGSTFQWNMVTAPGVRRGVESGEEDEELAPCWFEHFSTLLALHRRERWDEQGWFERLDEHVSALMLDDIGVDAGTPYRESFLLRHIEWMFRSRSRALILTLNAPPTAWSTLLGQRIADRLLDSRWFVRVALVGESLR